MKNLIGIFLLTILLISCWKSEEILELTDEQRKNNLENSQKNLLDSSVEFENKLLDESEKKSKESAELFLLKEENKNKNLANNVINNENDTAQKYAEDYYKKQEEIAKKYAEELNKE